MCHCFRNSAIIIAYGYYHSRHTTEMVVSSNQILLRTACLNFLDYSLCNVANRNSCDSHHTANKLTITLLK